MAIPDFYYPGSTLVGVTGPHADNLKRAEHQGLFTGLVGFGPDWDAFAEMTRGEAAQVLWNLMQTF